MSIQFYFHPFAILSILLEFSMIVAMVKEIRQRRNTLTYLLLGGFISGMGWIALTYLNLGWINDMDYRIASIVGLLANLSGNLSFTFLAMFFRSMIRPRIDTRQFATLMSLNAAMVGTRYASVVVAFDNDFEKYIELRGSATVFNLMILAYFLFSISKDYNEMTQEQLTPRQLHQVRLFYFPLLISQVLGIFIVILSTPSLLGLDVLVFGFITSAGGTVVLAYSFFSDQSITSVFRDKTYIVFVANRGGTLKFSRNFYTGDISQSVLLSGGITAITSLLNELYDFSLEPRAMQFDNGYIHFQTHRDFFVIAFSKNESTQIKRGIRKLSELIEKKYSSNLPTIMTDVEPLIIHPEFEEAFYFLKVTNGE